jgi:hypothetical protein
MDLLSARGIKGLGAGVGAGGGKLVALLDGRGGGGEGLSVACDEGMPNRPSIFAYLVFGPGRTTSEGITRPITLIA